MRCVLLLMYHSLYVVLGLMHPLHLTSVCACVRARVNVGGKSNVSAVGTLKVTHWRTL